MSQVKILRNSNQVKEKNKIIPVSDETKPNQVKGLSKVTDPTKPRQTKARIKIRQVNDKTKSVKFKAKSRQNQGPVNVNITTSQGQVTIRTSGGQINIKTSTGQFCINNNLSEPAKINLHLEPVEDESTV